MVEVKVKYKKPKYMSTKIVVISNPSAFSGLAGEKSHE